MKLIVFTISLLIALLLLIYWAFNNLYLSDYLYFCSNICLYSSYLFYYVIVSTSFFYIYTFLSISFCEFFLLPYFWINLLNLPSCDSSIIYDYSITGMLELDFRMWLVTERLSLWKLFGVEFPKWLLFLKLRNFTID